MSDDCKSVYRACADTGPGQFHCERPLDHDGVHHALDGDVEWPQASEHDRLALEFLREEVPADEVPSQECYAYLERDDSGEMVLRTLSEEFPYYPTNWVLEVELSPSDVYAVYRIVRARRIDTSNPEHIYGAWFEDADYQQTNSTSTVTEDTSNE